ncbi:MAG: RNA polymerase sigma factor [Bdellovibrionales bacterium]
MGRDLTALVKGTQQGNAKDAKELVEATQTRLYRFCLLLTGDRPQAEDILQEAYLKAFSAIHTLSQPEAFWGWIFQISRNLFLDSIRSAKPTVSILDHSELEAESPDLAYTITVHQVLSRFESEDRLLLMLVDLEKFTYREAGAALGISEDAVRSRLFRLRKDFLEIWQKLETK